MKCLTGLTVAGFLDLLPAFKAAYEADLAQRDAQRSPPRQRERGAGQKGVLPQIADKLVFILFYFRMYPVQMAQGFFFGMGQPQANDWIQRLSPVVRTALGYDLQLPARTPQDIKALLETCPGLEFIIDGPERPIRRPKHPARQKSNYSGKKKRHTRKNNVISARRTGKIKGLSPTVEGKRHDKKRADEQQWVYPEGSKVWNDTGFQGYEPLGGQTFQPTKKPKGRELTPAERLTNAALSKQRIGIEHSLGGVKVFRNLRQGFDDLVIEIACGLHNFRLDHRLTA
jgi:hypothetical protein